MAVRIMPQIHVHCSIRFYIIVGNFIILTLVKYHKFFFRDTGVYNGCKNNAPNKSFKISLSFVPSRVRKICLALLIRDSHSSCLKENLNGDVRCCRLLP